MYKEMYSEYILSIHLAQINWFHFAVEQSVTSWSDILLGYIFPEVPVE